MFISFLSLAMLPLMITPIMTHELFGHVYDFEKTIIGMDNGAIVLGRADRKTFNFLEKTNLLLESLERFHHPIHAVVLGGLASPSTVAQDKAIELFIERVVTGSMAIAQTMWKKSEFGFFNEVRRHTSLVELSQRSPTLPVRRKRCVFCGLIYAFEIKSRESQTVINSKEFPNIKPVIIDLFPKKSERNRKWEYQFLQAF